MVMISDSSIGYKQESTYGTGVTVDRWIEYTAEELTQHNEYVDSDGLRVGGIGVDLSRRILGKVVADGTIETEVVTRGFGTLWSACLGTSTSNLRSGSIYQQRHTPATSDQATPFTVQKGVVEIGGGTVRAHTFLGGCVDSWKLSAKAGEALMLEVDWLFKEMVTATAYASPSYAASARTLGFPHLAVHIGVNGSHALTVPTTTALGSTTASSTPYLNINSIEFAGKNNLDSEGYNSGGAGKRTRAPAFGRREFSGSLTAEFDATSGVTMRDYYLNQSDLHMVATFTSDQDNIAGSGTFAALQVVLPSIRLEGSVPTANGDEVVQTDIPFTAGRNSNQTIYVVCVTADTAL